MSWILLTNDDGPDSPALVPFARALAPMGELRVVVPREERSWVGKAITRFEPVHVEKADRDGVSMWLCSGYPADGVQLGINGLFSEPPELVISGINLGYNHGAGYILSSGTIGAAFEAWVSGVPALAFSTGTMSDWNEWRARAKSPQAADDWIRLGRLCADMTAEIRGTTLADEADIVSVNLPYESDEHTPRQVTSIARVGYDKLFRADGEGRFVHSFGGAFRQFDVLDGTDVDAAHRRQISITPIRMPQAASLSEEMIRELEQS
ncbi:MAG: 5'/3'-nucleotidase SurE [Acidimicrobiia bacterium]